MVIGYVAGGTKTIRVGSGGVMLPNHSPLVIAEQFGTLASLYPGRIDLGLGRAPGTDMATARALRRDPAAHADHFPEDVQELQSISIRCMRDKKSKPFQEQVFAFPSGCLAPACSAPIWQRCWGCPLRLPRILLPTICSRRWPFIATSSDLRSNSKNRMP